MPIKIDNGTRSESLVFTYMWLFPFKEKHCNSSNYYIPLHRENSD